MLRRWFSLPCFLALACGVDQAPPQAEVKPAPSGPDKSVAPPSEPFQVNLPKGPDEAESVETSASGTVVVSVDGKGSMKIGAREVDAAALRAQLCRAVTDSTATSVDVVAAESTPHKFVVEIMDAARDCGVPRVGILHAVGVPEAEAKEPPKRDTLTLACTKDGSVLVDGQTARTDEEIRKQIADRVAVGRPLEAIIECDQALPVQTVVRLIDLLREAGVTKYALWTKEPGE